MSVLFFVVAAAMVLVALGWVLPALLRGRAVTGIDRDQQNIVIARERLAELDAQAQAGVIGAAELEAARAEVESTLLDDVAAPGAGETAHERVTAGSPWAGMVVAAAVPLLAGLLYLTLGMPRALLGDGAGSAALPVDHPEVSADQPASVEELLAKVEARLRDSPQDAKGWEILANTYMALNRYSDAADALQRLLELVGEQAELLVRRADALAMSKGGELRGEPEKLLSRALELDPDHPTGLWLSGIAAERRGDTAKSLEFLRKAQPLFADKPESAAALREQIASAEQKLGIAAAPPDTGAAIGPGPAQKPPTSITVQVSLDEVLGQQVSPDDTVFIIARAVNGPRMPLAVARKSVKDLPVKVRLDDSMAMVPNMKLSNYAAVELVARVSKTGNAIAQSGDLIGRNGPLDLPVTGPVAIAISERVP